MKRFNLIVGGIEYVQDAKDKKENEKIWLKKLEKSLLKDSAWDRRN